MTRLTIWAVRLALVYFAASITLGALALTAKAGYVSGWWLGLRAIHIQLGFVGWLVQLVIGVGYWILPKSSKTGTKRPRAWAAVASVVAVNLSVVVGVAGYWWGPGRPLGAVLGLAAALLFGWHAWPRVKPARG